MVLQVFLERHGPGHASTLLLRNSLAVDLHRLGKRAEALALHEENVKAAEASLGRDNASTILIRRNLADSCLELGRLEDGARLSEENLAICEAALGPDHEETFDSRMQRASAHRSQGQWLQAEALARQCVEQARRVVGPRDARHAGALAALGNDLLRLERWVEAEKVLRECLEIRKETETEAWRTHSTISCLGAALLGQGDLAGAERLLLEGYEGMKRREDHGESPYPVRLQEAIERLVRLAEARREPEAAARWRAELEKLKGP